MSSGRGEAVSTRCRSRLVVVVALFELVVAVGVVGAFVVVVAVDQGSVLVGEGFAAVFAAAPSGY